LTRLCTSYLKAGGFFLPFTMLAPIKKRAFVLVYKAHSLREREPKADEGVGLLILQKIIVNTNINQLLQFNQ
jgi:hypothetical protein